MSPLYRFVVESINGQKQSLESFKGKVILIVNTASQCGFTPQYARLQALYEQYHQQGLVILAFPCNQFGKQEPGTAKDILHFCETTYHVSFPLMAKVDVKGANADPLFQYLTKEAPGLLGTKAIKWNFTKFLINRQGQVVKRYAPQTDFKELETNIQTLLAEPTNL